MDARTPAASSLTWSTKPTIRAGSRPGSASALESAREREPWRPSRWTRSTGFRRSTRSSRRSPPWCACGTLSGRRRPSWWSWGSGTIPGARWGLHRPAGRKRISTTFDVPGHPGGEGQAPRLPREEAVQVREGPLPPRRNPGQVAACNPRSHTLRPRARMGLERAVVPRAPHLRGNRRPVE